MLAGALSTGFVDFNWTTLLQLLSLWLVVDPIFGTLWELAVERGLWRAIGAAKLPPPPPHGFWLPYVRPHTPGGRLVRQVRRYQAWWRMDYWPQRRDEITAYAFGTVLALLITLFLKPAIFWLALLALALIITAGQGNDGLAGPAGGRLQSVVQFLIPWAMGALLGGALTPLSLITAVCYWVTYLGGLRLLGHHERAQYLFFLGQIAVICLLLALRLLPGAAIVGVLLLAQQIVRTRHNPWETFLLKVQPYLIGSVIIAGFALG